MFVPFDERLTGIIQKDTSLQSDMTENTNTINIAIFDFDSTMCYSPMPEPGKQMWAEHHGKDYPTTGWWGRLESMDEDVFDIQTNPEVHAEWDKYYELEYDTYILTSRQPKFTDIIKSILIKNSVDVVDVLTQRGKATKGERILEMITHYNRLGIHVEHVIFFDDRQKEHDTVILVQEEIEKLGTRLELIKVQSDAQD